MAIKTSRTRRALWVSLFGTQAFAWGPTLIREIVIWVLGETAGSLFGDDFFQRAAAILSEYQDIIFGISIGIGFSLFVIYWPLIKAKTRRGFRWIGLFSHVLRMSVSGDMRLGSGGTTIPAGDTTTSLPLDATIRSEKARVLYESDCPARVRIVGSRVYFTRRDKDASEKLKVSYEIWGRHSLFGAIKKYWRMDYFDLLEDVERWHKEREKS